MQELYCCMRSYVYVSLKTLVQRPPLLYVLGKVQRKAANLPSALVLGKFDERPQQNLSTLAATIPCELNAVKAFRSLSLSHVQLHTKRFCAAGKGCASVNRYPFRQSHSQRRLSIEMVSRTYDLYLHETI